MGKDELDLVNRDPNKLNDHIAVAFHDVLGEPDGLHSIDCVWANSYKCFECGKSLCYKIMTTLCGICIALEWGCEFAMLTFNHVWIWTPCLRDLNIVTSCFQKFVTICLSCCMVPICESFGTLFSNIHIGKG